MEMVIIKSTKGCIHHDQRLHIGNENVCNTNVCNKNEYHFQVGEIKEQECGCL